MPQVHLLLSRALTYCLTVWLRFQVSRTRIPENAQCPGCGHRRGTIRFSREQAAVIHSCLICSASWCEEPLVDPSVWVAP